MSEGEDCDPVVRQVLIKHKLEHLIPRFVQHRIHLQLAKLVPASTFCKLLDITPEEGDLLVAAFASLSGSRSSSSSSNSYSKARDKAREGKPKTSSDKLRSTSSSSSSSHDRSARDRSDRSERDHKRERRRSGSRSDHSAGTQNEHHHEEVEVAEEPLLLPPIAYSTVPAPHPEEEEGLFGSSQPTGLDLINEAMARPSPELLLRDVSWLEELLSKATQLQESVSEQNVEMALLNQTVTPEQLGEANMRRQLKKDIEEAELERARIEARLAELRATRSEILQRKERQSVVASSTPPRSPLYADHLLAKIENGDNEAITSVSDQATLREIATAVRQWSLDKSTEKAGLQQMIYAAIACGISRQAQKGVKAALSFDFKFLLDCLLRPNKPEEILLLTRLSTQVLAWLMYYIPDIVSNWVRSSPLHTQNVVYLLLQPSWRSAGAPDEDNTELILVPLLERDQDGTIVRNIFFVLSSAVEEALRPPRLQRTYPISWLKLAMPTAKERPALPSIVPPISTIIAVCSAMQRLIRRSSTDQASLALRRGLASGTCVELLRSAYAHHKSAALLPLILQHLIEVFKAILLSDVDVPGRPVTTAFMGLLLDFHSNLSQRLLSTFSVKTNERAFVGIGPTKVAEFTILLIKTNDVRVLKHIWESKICLGLLRACALFPSVDIFLAQVEQVIRIIFTTGNRSLTSQIVMAPDWPAFWRLWPDLTSAVCPVPQQKQARRR